jgi:hypothetical protein
MRMTYFNNNKITEDATLEEAQAFRQEQNKGALERFLATATVEYNGRLYGVTEADQNEIQAAVAQYQLLTNAGIEAELQWHAKHETSRTFTLEEIAQLMALVQEFVQPHMAAMQEAKEQIYRAQTVDEVMAVEIFKAV